MHSKGFTLIEIVMAMVIIGLLSAIILPKYFNKRDIAAAQIAYKNMSTVLEALEKFYLTEGYFPNEHSINMLYDGSASQTYLPDMPKNNYCGNGSNTFNGPQAEGGWFFRVKHMEKTDITRLLIRPNCDNSALVTFKEITGIVSLQSDFGGKYNVK